MASTNLVPRIFKIFPGHICAIANSTCLPAPIIDPMASMLIARSAPTPLTRPLAGAKGKVRPMQGQSVPDIGNTQSAGVRR